MSLPPLAQAALGLLLFAAGAYVVRRLFLQKGVKTTAPHTRTP